MLRQTVFAGAFARLADEPGDLAWLDAGAQAQTGSSYLVLPSADSPQLVASIADAAVREGAATHHSDVFEVLRQRWRPGRGTANEPSFAGGWVGWFGYECAQDTLGIRLTTEGSGYPDAAWFRAGAWARLEHASGEVTLDGADTQALDRLRTALAEPLRPRPAAPAAALTTGWRDGPAHYADTVRAAQQFIADGEAYQLCLTSRVSGPPPEEPAQQIYLRLRRRSPSHHGSFIRIDDTAVLSSSPEQFLELSPSGRLRSKPIKGTRPRGTDAVSDAALARELRESPKEQAENVMIVDLMRNDLGRVAVSGSVSVPHLLTVESYPPVHQLVSTVQAQLAPGIHPLEAVRGAFPAGSMTGAPKHRAVQLLQQLESGPRGIYSGVSGYLSDNGSIDLAMNIRCVVLRPEGWALGAGGGITALSVPEEEVAESRLKAAALLAALGVGTAD